LEQNLFNSANGFRVTAMVVAVLMMLYSSASLFSEVFSLRRPLLPADPSKIAFQPIELTARWAAAVSPLRSDLDANYAMTLALLALRPDNAALSAPQVQKYAEAQESVVGVLEAAPYNSALWLALALLQRNPKGRQIIEALKMSYFTAPNDAQLMPLRLFAATHSDALSDSDLRELARGDVRLMLTRKADLKTAVVSAFQSASSLGKTFLEESVRSIDPALIPLLRSQKPT
jgi:hypothetical protein